MLQQTRIAAVIPYYQRFLKRFPDVRLAGARAARNEVLKHVVRPGLLQPRAQPASRRAGNRRAARWRISARRSNAALALPGIGRYTAAAVLSIAYDEPLAVLDGNVARVLARLDAIRGDLREPRRWRRLGSIAAELLLAARLAGDWNQALMELGETVCTPRIPRCAACPVSRWCAARALRLDRRDSRAAPKTRAGHECASPRRSCAIRAGRTLLVRDPGAHDEVLFSRMWQFPAVEVARDAEAELRAYLAKILRLDRCDARSSRRCPPRATASRSAISRCCRFSRACRDFPRARASKILPLANLRRVPVSSATRKIAAAAVSGIRVWPTCCAHPARPREC